MSSGEVDEKMKSSQQQRKMDKSWSESWSENLI